MLLLVVGLCAVVVVEHLAKPSPTACPPDMCIRLFFLSTSTRAPSVGSAAHAKKKMSAPHVGTRACTLVKDVPLAVVRIVIVMAVFLLVVEVGVFVVVEHRGKHACGACVWACV